MGIELPILSPVFLIALLPSLLYILSLISFSVFRCLLNLPPCCKDADIKVGSEGVTITHMVCSCLKMV